MNNNNDPFIQNNEQQQNAPERHCPRCGALVPENATFCGNCGLSLMPQKTDVLSVGDYLLMMVLFSIPVAGLVLMLYWGFSSRTAVNRKHFARAYLIFYVLNMVLSIAMLGSLTSIVTEAAGSSVSLF